MAAEGVVGEGAHPQAAHVQVGVDIGGTFTDFCVLRDGSWSALKLPSTPAAPERAVHRGLRELGLSEGFLLAHGATVGLNALLTRALPRVALLATRGFEDLLELGRQTRPGLYDLLCRRPAPLVPRELRFGLSERLAASGEVLCPLDPAEVQEVVGRLQAAGVESVAICFLYGFLDARHERVAARIVRQAGLPCSLSSEVLPEFREYERTVATVLDAALQPVLAEYVRRLRDDETVRRAGVLRIMQSNGGSATPEMVVRRPIHSIFSGPAAGVIGAWRLAAAAGHERVITFDMGGTSTDVSLCPGRIQTTARGEIAGLPLPVPLVDIHTVGAGGGSIARVDPGGALKVGPQSAGADPGPACYGRGGPATVTDAHVVLGRIRPGRFLGGRMALDPAAARRALAAVARPLGLSIEETARGILEVVNATMMRAIKVISIQRGFDLREYCLVAFGGAGGLHAVELARGLRIPRVLVPARSGILSALGLLLADLRRDYSRTVMRPAGDRAALDRGFRELVARAREELGAEGFPPEAVTFTLAADMRYRGQSHEITVAGEAGVSAGAQDWSALFHRAHERLRGYAMPGEPVEVVTIRLAAVAPPRRAPLDSPAPPAHAAGEREPLEVELYTDRRCRAPAWPRAALAPGTRLAGPALILEDHATTYLPPGAMLEVDRLGNLVIEVH
jgi:N-methylhydantoinase A